MNHWWVHWTRGLPHFKRKKVLENQGLKLKLERAKGFEPSTSTLARSRSTPELHPQSCCVDVFMPYFFGKSK